MYGCRRATVGSASDGRGVAAVAAARRSTVPGSTPTWSDQVIQISAGSLSRTNGAASRIASSIPVGDSCSVTEMRFE